MTELVLALRLKADKSGVVGEIRATKEELESISTAGRQAGAGASAGMAKAESAVAGVKEQVRAAREGMTQLGTSAQQASVRATSGLSTVAKGTAEVSSQARMAANLMTRLEAAGSAATTGLIKGFSLTQRGVAGVYANVNSLQGAIAALGLVQAAKNVVATADAYTLLEGRLKLVTNGNEQLRDVQGKLFELAQKSRTPFEATAGLYADMAAAGQDLNATQAQMLKVTGAVGSSLIVAGRSASQASGAIFQLGQLFGGPIVQAQEYNSLIDNMRPLLASAAKHIEGTGGTVAGLTKIVKDGNLTTREFFMGIVAGADEISASAASMKTTAGQAFIQLQNEVQRAVAAGDMSPLVDSIDDLKAILTDPAVLAGLTMLASGVATATGWAARGAGAFADFGVDVGEAIGRFQVHASTFEKIIAVMSLASPVTAAQMAKHIFGERTPSEIMEEEAKKVGDAVADVFVEIDKLTGAKAAIGAGPAVPLRGLGLGPLADAKTMADRASAAASAQGKLDEATKKANETAAEQIKVMERTLALIKSGVAADEAAKRAKLELDGVNATAIDRIVSLDRQTAAYKKTREEATAAQKRATEINEEAARVQEALAKAEIEARNAAIKRSDELRPEVDDLKEVLDLVQRGMTVETARHRVQIQRLQGTAAELSAKGEEIAAQNVLLEVEKLRTEKQIDGISARRDAEQAASQALVEEQERRAEQLEQSLTDALLRGFESGKGFAENFADTLVNTFKAMVLRPTISFIVDPIAGALNSVISQALSGALSGVGGSLSTLLTGGINNPGAAGFVGPVQPGTAVGMGLGTLGSAAVGAAGAYGLYQLGSLLAASDSNVSGRNQGLASLLTGGQSLALSGLDKLTGGNILGTKWKTSDSGILLDLMGDDLEGQTFDRQKKKRSLGRGTKRRTQYDDLDQGTEDVLQEIYSSFAETIGSLGELLGVATDDFANFTASIRVSTKGLSQEDAAKAVEDALRAQFSAFTDQIFPFMDEFAVRGESTSDTLLRVTSNLTTVNAVLDLLDRTAGLTGQGLLEMSEDLVALFGGDSSALGQAAARFYDVFTSDAEKFEDLTATVSSALTGLNLTLPTTRDGFRTLVDGLDLTTESGREAFATLLRLSDQAGAYYSELERQAAAAAQAQAQLGADALSAQSVALKDSAKEFDDAVKAFRDGFADISDALKATLASIAAVRGGIAQSVLGIQQTAPGFSSLDYQRELIGSLRGKLSSGSVDDRVDTVDQLQKAVARRYQLEFEAINKARQADLDRYTAQMQQADSMRQALQGLKGLVDGLKLGDLSILRPREQLDEARSQYGRALMAAQSGTDPSTVQNLQSALQTYLQQARDFFGSDERYQDIFRSTLAETSRVSDRGVGVLPPNTGFYDQAISEAQNSALDELDALQSQLDELQEQANELFIDSFATLNGTLEAQTNALTSVMEATTQAVMDRVGGAVDAAAIEAQQAGQLAIATMQRTSADVRAELRAVGYQIASTVSSAVSYVASTRNVA